MPDRADATPRGATGTPSGRRDADTAPEGAPAPTARKPREGTKQAQLITMLRTAQGATIDEIVVAAG